MPEFIAVGRFSTQNMTKRSAPELDSNDVLSTLLRTSSLITDVNRKVCFLVEGYLKDYASDMLKEYAKADLGARALKLCALGETDPDWRREEEALKRAQQDLVDRWEVLTTSCYDKNYSGKRDEDLKTLLQIFDKLLDVAVEPYVKNGQINMPHDIVEKLYRRYRGDLMNVISNMISTGRIGFPFKKFTMTHPKILFENLSKFENEKRIDKSPFSLKGHSFKSGDFFPFKYKGEYLSFLSTSDDYFSMDIITEYFQEHIRLKSRRQDQRQPPLEQWKNSSVNYSVVKKVVLDGKDLDTFNLREALYSNVSEFFC